MLSDDNGCLCHMLPADARPCIACRGRAESEAKCKRCGVGLFDHEENPDDKNGLCSNCYYAGH